LTKSIGNILRGITYQSCADLPSKINNISNNSQQIKPGDMFIAIQGQQIDGHQFIPQAVENGAAVIVCEEFHSQCPIPQILVTNSRKALARIAANYYDNPTDKLTVIGVTGTNGKTTTVYLLKSILKQAKIASGSIGTLGYYIEDSFYALTLTTPDSLQLQQIFSQMVNENIATVVMEVSSHALALDRIEGISFKGGIFTNISQDHLDFHLTMENYVAAKLRFFPLIIPTGFRLVNLDDSYSEQFKNSGKARLLTYSIGKPADFSWQPDVKYSNGISGDIAAGSQTIPIKSSLSGKHNLSNILAATAGALQLGIQPATITKAIASVAWVPGRLQEIRQNGFPRTFVDYAHTPDAIINVLKTLRDIVPSDGRLITIFGCGGNRDRTKRPLMASAAASLSDMVIVTTDNPRFEEPEAIIQEIVEGFPDNYGYYKITDRKTAIEFGLKQGTPKDVIAILGKGHENYQEIKGVRYPFYDVEIVENYFGKKR
jgi:UDP-N-acetylmuramoyl-L-alanyl-D-glutamate--2,6-diaminopimelate ligase